MRGRLSVVIGVALALALGSRAAPALDFDAFKSRVEPGFLKKREGQTRCYVCHADYGMYGYAMTISGSSTTTARSSSDARVGSRRTSAIARSIRLIRATALFGSRPVAGCGEVAPT